MPYGPRIPRFSQSPDRTQGSGILRAYEAAKEMDIQQERLGQQQQASDERINLARENLQLRQEADQRAQDLKMREENNKLKATVARQAAADKFYEGVAKLSPQSKDFLPKYTDLMRQVHSGLVDAEGKLPQGVMDISNHLFTQNATWESTQTKQAAPVDPLKLASQFDKQATDLRLQHAANEKEIAGIAKAAPWIDTTGLDPATQMFGYKDRPSEKATQNEVAQYQAYTGALAKRAKLQEGLDTAENTRTAILNGTYQPPSAPATAPLGEAPIASGTATPSGAMDTSGSTNGTATPPAAAPAIDIHDEARAALQKGAPRDAVIQRLQSLGGDPSKL